MSWLRTLKVFLYHKIEEFAQRYPEAVNSEAKAKAAPKKKVWRQGKRASRRGRGEDAAAAAAAAADADDSDEDESDEDEDEDEDEDGEGGTHGGDDQGDGDQSGNGAVFDEQAYSQEMQFLKGLGLEDEEMDERNPMHKKSYFDLPPRTRLVILKALCDWQLETHDDETNKEYRDMKLFRDGKLEPADLRVEPFADDRQENLFWYFDCGSRVYRESRADMSPKSRRGATKLITLPAQKWEAIACDIEELEAFLGKLNKKKHKSEVDLRKSLKEILEDWTENFTAREKAREKQERTNLAMLNVKRSSRVQLLEQKEAEEQQKKDEQDRIEQIRREEDRDRRAQKATQLAAIREEADRAAAAGEDVDVSLLSPSIREAYVEERARLEETAEQAAERKERNRMKEIERQDMLQRERIAEDARQQAMQVQVMGREERKRRREMGEAAPPPTWEMQKQLRNAVVGDWVEIVWPGDGNWYYAEVIKSTPSRLRLLYPES